MPTDIEKLQKQIDDLKDMVTDLRRKLEDNNELKDDFADFRVINYKVQFLREVTDKDGTVQIN